MSEVELPADAPRPRQCTLRKWPDFNGYGFNLHAEKQKVGQFIGKVDDESPAFYAGLRQGDRIVEVNNTNVCNETHSQVVDRVRKCGDQVSMLVVDVETDKYYDVRGLTVSSTWPNVEYHETPIPRPGQDIDADNIVADNIVAAAVAVEVKADISSEPEEQIETVVVATESEVIEAEPIVDDEPECIVIAVNEDKTVTTVTESQHHVADDKDDNDDQETTTVTTVITTTTVVEEVKHAEVEVDGSDELLNGEADIVSESTEVVESVAPPEREPTPPPPAYEHVNNEVTESVVVATTVTKKDEEEPRVPTPEPETKQPESTVIVQTTTTTVVESTPPSIVNNENQAKTNGNVDMLSMSAKEYQEYLRAHRKGDARHRAANFKEKKDMFDHL
ncbi:uncharacterized protein LOC141912437 [Tubulanus polymorphus]|uniref:uncharacterized protein LOC141912437 n=1 Tax=Tubulanus polymorphus TaxID=672921 RepID=UPI003DA4E64D